MVNGASLSTIAGPAFLVAFIYLTVFEILRIRWPNFYAPRCKGIPPHKGLLQWIPGVWGISEEEVVRRSGMDAAVYLRVQGMGAMIMAILTFFGLVILMPIFDSGDEAMRDFNRYSIANLSNMSSLLWAPAVMMWIFSLLCFVIIVKNYHEIYKLRLQSVGTGEGQEYAIMITGIPLEYDTEDKVKKDLQKKYPGEGLVVQIIRDESDLRKAVSRLKKENLKLIRAQQYKVQHSDEKVRKRIGCCSCLGYGEVVEPVSYHMARVEDLKAKARKEKDEKGRFVGVAFVMFDAITTATKAGSTTLADNPDTWNVGMAPKPADILWGNVENVQPNSVKAVLSLTKSGALFAICVFWSIPVAFINAFSNLATLAENYPWLSFLKDLDPFWQSVITGMVPGLLLVILMLILYPILWNLVKMTGVLTFSELEFTFMRDYFMFLLIDVFFITLLTSSIWQTLHDIADDPKSIFQQISEAIPSVAVIEIGYILIQSLMVETERIVRVWFLLLSFGFSFMSSTEFESQQATQPERFSYGGSLAYSALIFTICFIYSCIAPAILPFGALYFGINYTINKYKLLYVQELSFDTYGKFFPKVMDHIFTGIIIGQVALMGIIGLKLGAWQQPFLFPLPICTYLLSSYLHNYYGKELSQTKIPLTTAASRDAGRSPDKVQLYLKEWYDGQFWKQPCCRADLEKPLKPIPVPPTWERRSSLSEIISDDDIKLEAESPGGLEHAPLLSVQRLDDDEKL